MYTLLALLIGFGLDLLFGDPRAIPHPVVLMGKAIALMERGLRRVFPKTDAGEFAGGVVLAAALPILSLAVSGALLYVAQLVHPLLRLALESFWCFQIFAARSLRDESMRVCAELKRGDLPAARVAVSYIVGRDTGALDETGVTKAAVETVAENCGDGVVAPMIFMAIGGAPLGFFYKAINTMDSMVGYKNERYRRFGTAAARLDDFVNLVPARLAGLIMAPAAALCGFDAGGAFRIFKRDRKNHSSPNSAHTEAACAGALGIRLAGDASYFGKLTHKPTIGDALRPVETEDIARANRLMYADAGLCLALCAVLRLAAALIFKF